MDQMLVLRMLFFRRAGRCTPQASQPEIPVKGILLNLHYPVVHVSQK